MAAYLKFNKFSQNLVQGLCGNMESLTIKIALTNTAPVAATQTVYDSVTLHAVPAAANG